jgi:hypothetical protein
VSAPPWHAKLLPALILLNEGVAIVCQFIQRTDPRFPLVYFTVNSAVLAAFTATLALATRRFEWLPALRITSAVGVLLSAAVFATVIAPATATGTWFQPWDDAWVRTSTVLMHGTAPVLVAVDVAASARWRGLPAWVSAGLSWPLCYLVGISLLTSVGMLAMPYPFLAPARMGWGTVSLAVFAMALLTASTAAALYWANRVVSGTKARPG